MTEENEKINRIIQKSYKLIRIKSTSGGTKDDTIKKMVDMIKKVVDDNDN